MGDVVVVEAPEHMDDGIRIPDVGKELVAEPLSFRRPFHESRNIHYLYRCGNHFLRIVYTGEFHQPFVRDGNDSHIGFYRAEWEIGRLSLRIGEAVEQRRFADVGQTDYPAL